MAAGGLISGVECRLRIDRIKTISVVFPGELVTPGTSVASASLPLMNLKRINCSEMRDPH